MPDTNGVSTRRPRPDVVSASSCGTFSRTAGLPASQHASVRLPLSVFIVACNEAERIGATLASVVDLVDEIVVLDSGSTDGTTDIAAAFGARVVHRAWQGYGHQKRHAESLCRHAWRLNLDADEVVGATLACELRALFRDGPPAPAAYRMRIVEVLPGETRPRMFAPCHDYVRLYHADVGRFRASTVHDGVELVPGVTTRRLAGRVHHHSFRDTARQIDKFNRYSDALVLDLEAGGRALPAWRLATEFPLAFLKAFVIRRHALRGGLGYVTAMNYAIFRHLRVAKHLERRWLERR